MIVIGKHNGEEQSNKNNKILCIFNICHHVSKNVTALVSEPVLWCKCKEIFQDKVFAKERKVTNSNIVNSGMHFSPKISEERDHNCFLKS